MLNRTPTADGPGGPEAIVQSVVGRSPVCIKVGRGAVLLVWKGRIGIPNGMGTEILAVEVAGLRGRITVLI
ncbi:hypothetical protein GCM10009578_065720 [Streptomyces rhizosphaericus]